MNKPRRGEKTRAAKKTRSRLALRTTRRATALRRPTRDEDERIRRGIAADPDTFEPTDEEFAEFRPATEVAPELVAAHLRRRGQKAPTKEHVTIRIDRDLMEVLRRGGPGWQSRLNAMLRKVVLGEK